MDDGEGDATVDGSVEESGEAAEEHGHGTDVCFCLYHIDKNLWKLAFSNDGVDVFDGAFREQSVDESKENGRFWEDW